VTERGLLGLSIVLVSVKILLQPPGDLGCLFGSSHSALGGRSLHITSSRILLVLFKTRCAIPSVTRRVTQMYHVVIAAVVAVAAALTGTHTKAYDVTIFELELATD
jgi:hypothetical protein